MEKVFKNCSLFVLGAQKRAKKLLHQTFRHAVGFQLSHGVFIFLRETVQDRRSKLLNIK